MQLKTAERKKSFIRLNISSPSGAGKTYGALLIAKGLVGDWDKIGVIDTENGSANLYENLGDFKVLPMEFPFSPERYTEAINLCISEGMNCIIIDTASHEWNGKGGVSEINETLAQSKFKGNTWSARNHTTPRHDAFVQAMLQCKAHVIACTRSKTETVMIDNKVKKLGMKPIQREGWEYEFTISFNIDHDTHTAIADKDRTGLFIDVDPFVITEETGKTIKQWCESGAEPTPVPVKQGLNDVQFGKAIARLNEGDLVVFDNVMNTFTLTSDQEKMFVSVYERVTGPTQEELQF